jgi:hypothetical protein
MSDNNVKVVLPEFIEEIMVPTNFKDSEFVAEIKKLGKVQVKEVPSLGETHRNPVNYIGTIVFTNTQPGVATNPQNAVGSCDKNTFARFQATANQSTFGIYDMGVSVAGNVYICAKHGSTSPSNTNHVIVLASNHLNASWTQIGRPINITNSNKSNGMKYLVGSTEGASFKYYAIGAMAMGESNTTSDIAIYGLEIT